MPTITLTIRKMLQANQALATFFGQKAPMAQQLRRLRLRDALKPHAERWDEVRLKAHKEAEKDKDGELLEEEAARLDEELGEVLDEEFTIEAPRLPLAEKEDVDLVLVDVYGPVFMPTALAKTHGLKPVPPVQDSLPEPVIGEKPPNPLLDSKPKPEVAPNAVAAPADPFDDNC